MDAIAQPKTLNRKTPYVGVLLDSPSDVEKRYKEEEILTAFSPVKITWTEKKQVKDYPTRNQNGSNSCLAQAIQKADTILNGTISSATPIYKMRNTAPNVGMRPNNAMELALGNVFVDERILQSQFLSDRDMDAKDLVGYDLKKKFGAAVWVTDMSIDNIARILEQHKHLIVCFNSSYSEYIPDTGNLIEYKPTFKPEWSHAVCFHDYTLFNGKKYSVGDNSWGDVGQYQDTQLFSKDFCEKRIHSAFYFLPIQDVKDIPKYSFTRDLGLKMKGKDVVVLQDLLKTLGHMPNGIPSTGYFGDITRRAVVKLQRSAGFPIDLQTGYFGPLTRSYTNEIIVKKPGILDAILISLKIK